MCKGRVGVDVEHWECVFAILHSALHEDNGEEMDAGGVKKRQGGGLGEVAYVDDGDVANDV